MKILFVDVKSSTPFDSHIMRSVGIGGTEGSVVRVAEALARDHEVAVAQLGRERATQVGGVTYLPLQEAPFGGTEPDCVVAVRKHRLVTTYRRRFARARLYCWIHNWQRTEVVLKRAGLVRAQAGLVTVSDTHRLHTERRINGALGRAMGIAALAPGRLAVHRIYNPIDDALAPDDTPVDRNLLVYLSTANKGLERVLRRFGEVRRRMPAMRLRVAGTDPRQIEHALPGCARLAAQPGVEIVGRVPQARMLRLTRAALCVFYPQDVHPETFGLVFAESNAVGTPVLAHDFGAAREILGDPAQLVDARDGEAVVRRIEAWRNGARPRVAARPEFRCATVAAAWRRLLEGGG